MINDLRNKFLLLITETTDCKSNLPNAYNKWQNKEIIGVQGVK